MSSRTRLPGQQAAAPGPPALAACRAGTASAPSLSGTGALPTGFRSGDAATVTSPSAGADTPREPSSGLPSVVLASVTLSVDGIAAAEPGASPMPEAAVARGDGDAAALLKSTSSTASSPLPKPPLLPTPKPSPSAAAASLLPMREVAAFVLAETPTQESSVARMPAYSSVATAYGRLPRPMPPPPAPRATTWLVAAARGSSSLMKSDGVPAVASTSVGLLLSPPTAASALLVLDASSPTAASTLVVP
eukprot:354625-Chlamydomonas_euryale.AAC.11